MDYTNKGEFVIINKYIFLQDALRGEDIQKVRTDKLQMQQKEDIF